MDKFIYVFSLDDVDILIKAGYSLLRRDDANKIYILANEDCVYFNFSENPIIKHITSNILSF